MLSGNPSRLCGRVGDVSVQIEKSVQDGLECEALQPMIQEQKKVKDKISRVRCPDLKPFEGYKSRAVRTSTRCTSPARGWHLISPRRPKSRGLQVTEVERPGQSASGKDEEQMRGRRLVRLSAGRVRIKRETFRRAGRYWFIIGSASSLATCGLRRLRSKLTCEGQG